MLKRIILLIFVIISLFSFSLLFSDTIIVDISGSGNYTYIQEGIDNSVNGDTVLVYPGIYYENINYNGKNITVASLYLTTQNDSYIDSTIIDGNQNGSVVTFESGEDTTAVLCGFTIQNGSGTQYHTYYVGGGIYCIDSKPFLISCKIFYNTSDCGGGICLINSDPYFEDLCIINNRARHSGGGIVFFNDSSAHFDLIHKSNIYLNYAGVGSDLFASFNNNLVTVVLDTFTVAQPTSYFAYQLDKFSFDIQNFKIELIDHDLYVSPNGDNTNSGLSPSEPLQTISWAMTKIKSDSTDQKRIYIFSGTYSQAITGDIFPINCKDNVSLIGTDKNNTILIGNNYSSLLYIYEKKNVFVKNITLKYGYNNVCGGGIFIQESNNEILFCNMNIYNCSAHIGGGGIFCFDNSSPIFENVLIRNNSSDGGGGVYISFNSNPAFINCAIDSNYTITPGWGFGGGISNNVESNSIFINTQITNNVSDDCSGITVSGNAGSYCDPTFINCTICDNSANPGGTIRQGDNSNVSLINCILRNPSEYEIVFWESAPPETVMVAYCNIDGGIDAINTNNNGTIIWGDGNMDSLPQFVGGDPFSYQLQPSSPCIDKGTPDTTGLNLPATDLAGNPRIFNGRIDIGAYECQDTISINEPDTAFIHNLYLFQNTPNPFTNETEILFITADYERVEDYSLSIYNTKGQLVRRFDGNTHDFWVKTKIVWDGTDEQGRQVAPGTYLYKLEYNGNAVVRKMVKIR